MIFAARGLSHRAGKFACVRGRDEAGHGRKSSRCREEKVFVRDAQRSEDVGLLQAGRIRTFGLRFAADQVVDATERIGGRIGDRQAKLLDKPYALEATRLSATFIYIEDPQEICKLGAGDTCAAP